MIKITISEKRNPLVQRVSISENTTISTWGAIKVNKSDFFPSSFQIKTDSLVIYIDPIEVTTTAKADYILITHSHPDHLSLPDIRKLAKPDTKIICSKSVLKRMKGIGNEVHVMNASDSLKLNGIDILATPAYNTKPVFLWIKAHPKSKGNIGFILTTDSGIKIYHSGDTDYIAEMDRIANVDVALVAIGGDKLTMNEAEAAAIVNHIRPKQVIPMHYELRGGENIAKFRSLVDEAIMVTALE